MKNQRRYKGCIAGFDKKFNIINVFDHMEDLGMSERMHRPSISQKKKLVLTMC